MALGRGASEALFFKRYGIEYLPLMYIITSVLLCSISLIYAAFVDRIPSEKFYKILFIVLAVSLFSNWYIASYGTTKLVYPAFFLLYEVASELLLIHSAVYISQNLVQTQSKRLTPIILAGHQIGVISGGALLATVSPYTGVKNIMLLWMLLLFISYMIIRYWHANNGVSPYYRAGRKGRPKLEQSLNQLTQGMKLMKTSRLLRMSSFSLFFMVISVYILAYAVYNVYTEQFDTEESLSSFFGILTAVTGSLALLIQILFTNRLIRDQGIKRVNYIFPLTSIFSYILLLFSSSLPSAIIGSFNKETLMPAFAKPVRNIFNASLPIQLQGRAQAISVVLVIPLGLACAGIFLLLVKNIDDIENFLFIGLVCSFAYLIFNGQMNQAYAQEILSNLKKHLFIPDKHLNRFLNSNQKHSIQDIEQGLMSYDDDISVVYARLLSEYAPERATILIQERMKFADNDVKDQMIKILYSMKPVDLSNNLIEVIGTGDTHLDATILKALFQSRVSKEKYRVINALNHNNPRMKATGIYGALRYPIREITDKAIDEWITLLNSDHASNYMPAVELLVPEFSNLYLKQPLHNTVQNKLRQMMQRDDTQCIILALDTLSTWPSGSFDGFRDLILPLTSSSNWLIRNACIKASHLLQKSECNKLLHSAIEDQHPNVRASAIKLLASSQADDIAYVQHLLISKHTGSPRSIKTMLEYLMEKGADYNTMQSISITLANNARKLKLASHYLKNSSFEDSQESALLILALNERVYDTIDLCLFAIQASSHEDDIAVIRAGLNSNDIRQHSNACELLTMLNNKEISELVLPLFEDSGSTNKNGHDYILFDNINSLITWIQDLSDTWLIECANYFSASLKIKTYVRPD